MLQDIVTNFECHGCRSGDLLILLRSILAIKAPGQLQAILKEVVQLSLKRPQELSPAHMCLLISKAASFGFDIPYKKLQVRLLHDCFPIFLNDFESVCIFHSQACKIPSFLNMPSFYSVCDTFSPLLCTIPI